MEGCVPSTTIRHGTVAWRWTRSSCAAFAFADPTFRAILTFVRPTRLALFFAVPTRAPLARTYVHTCLLPRDATALKRILAQHLLYRHAFTDASTPRRARVFLPGDVCADVYALWSFGLLPRCTRCLTCSALRSSPARSVAFSLAQHARAVCAYHVIDRRPACPMPYFLLAYHAMYHAIHTCTGRNGHSTHRHSRKNSLQKQGGAGQHTSTYSR